MDDFAYIPLDTIGGYGSAPVGAGLLPSIPQTQRILDSLSRGPSPVNGAAQARALEDGAAMAVGAILSGAARAHGWGTQTTGLIGAAVAVYGTMSGHALLGQVGRGLAAPALAELGFKMFAPAAASAPAPANP